MEVNRRKATLIAIAFQYTSLGVLFVRGIVLVPIAAHYIDHDLLGAWYASGNVLNWLMLSEGGIWLLLRQQTAHEFGRRDPVRLDEVVGAGALLMLVVGVIVAFGCLLIGPHLPHLLSVRSEHADALVMAFQIAGIGLALSLPGTIPRSVAHGLQQPFGVNLVLLVAEIVSLALTIALLVAGFGVLALAIGLLAREIVHNLGNWPIYYLAMKRFGIAPKVTKRGCSMMLGQLGWVSTSNLGRTLALNVDAFVVSLLVDNSAVLASEWTKRLWEFAASLSQRFSSAFTSGMAHLHGEGFDSRFRHISNDLLSAMIVAGGLTSAVLLGINEQFVRIWVGATHYAGLPFDVLMAATTLLGLVVYASAELMFARNEIRGAALFQSTQAVVKIVCVVLFVAWFGIAGVPASALVALAVGGGMTQLSRFMRMSKVTGDEEARLIRSAICSGAVSAVAAVVWAFAPSANSWPQLIVSAGCLSLLVGLTFYLADPAVRVLVGLIISRVRPLR